MLSTLCLQCNPQNQFTCDNGQCIQIDKRCDKKSDCHDKSDENKCWQIKINEDRYLKSDAPESPAGQKTLEVGVWYEIMDIVEINEPEVSTILDSLFLYIGHYPLLDNKTRKARTKLSRSPFDKSITMKYD